MEAGRLQSLRTARPQIHLGSYRNFPLPAGDPNGATNTDSPPHDTQGSTNTSHRDLSEFDALSLRKKADTAGRPIWNFVKKRKSPLSFALYLSVGTVFYHYDEGNGAWVPRPNAIHGFFEAVTIGYSVGLSPKNPDYLPNPWFSSVYILCGATLIAVILTKLGQQMEDSASLNMFEALKRREDYEQKMSRENPFITRLGAFLNYNWAYLVVIFLWLLWLAAIVAWSTIATAETTSPWRFDAAQYFAISLCSSAGSFSLPSDAPDWAYGLAAVSMAVGVPLMALAISSIVIMVWQGHRFKKVKEAAWEPVAKAELEALEHLGLGSSDDEPISKGGFILLGMLRMGQDVGIIKYLADAYDLSEERGGVLFNLRQSQNEEEDTPSKSNTKSATGYYSAQANALVASQRSEFDSASISCDAADGDGGNTSEADLVDHGRTNIIEGLQMNWKGQWSTRGAMGDDSPRNLSDLKQFLGPSVDNALVDEEVLLRPNKDTVVMECGPILSMTVPSASSATTGNGSVITGGMDGSIKRFDISSSSVSLIGLHAPTATAADAKKVACSCLASLGESNPNLVASAGWDGKFHLWDVRSSGGKAVSTSELPGKAFSMDASRDGTKVVVATSGRRMCFFDIRKNALENYTGDDDGEDKENSMAKLLLDRESSLKFQTRCVKFFPDGVGMAVGSIEGRVAIEYLDEIGIKSGKKKYAFKCHRVNETIYPVNSIAFHPVLGTFATGGADGSVVTWDGANKKKLSTVAKLPTSVACLAFNEDGSQIAMASSYTFEEGERDHPRDEIYIRDVLDSEIRPKGAK
ncbi:hypothetical protein ACHAXS_009283 [Conticribra weissflogii]